VLLGRRLPWLFCGGAIPFGIFYFTGLQAQRFSADPVANGVVLVLRGDWDFIACLCQFTLYGTTAELTQRL